MTGPRSWHRREQARASDCSGRKTAARKGKSRAPWRSLDKCSDSRSARLHILLGLLPPTLTPPRPLSCRPHALLSVLPQRPPHHAHSDSPTSHPPLPNHLYLLHALRNRPREHRSQEKVPHQAKTNPGRCQRQCRVFITTYSHTRGPEEEKGQPCMRELPEGAPYLRRLYVPFAAILCLGVLPLSMFPARVRVYAPFLLSAPLSSGEIAQSVAARGGQSTTTSLWSSVLSRTFDGFSLDMSVMPPPHFH